MQTSTTNNLIVKYTAFSLLLIFLTVSTGFAESNFTQYDFYGQFQLEPVIDKNIANKITSYYSEEITIPLNQQKQELVKLEEELNILSDEYSDNAMFWFIKGLQHRNMAAFYTESNNSQLASSHIRHKDNAYKKAIELDRSSKNKLSAAIYSTMKHGLPQDLKIEATQNELALGGNTESDSQYWYLHWSNIDQLEKAGRKKEAEDAYKKMQQELKDSDMNKNIYKKLNTKIEKDTFKNRKTQKKIQKVKEHPDKPLIEMKYLIIYIISIISFLLLVSVTIYEVRKMKKK